jgi:hypothetical protein
MACEGPALSGAVGALPARRHPIDYTAALMGHPKLVPDAAALKVLEADYEKVAGDGILLDDAEPFAAVISVKSGPEAGKEGVVERLLLRHFHGYLIRPSVEEPFPGFGCAG